MRYLIALLAGLHAVSALGQDIRPIPYPVIPPPHVSAAVQTGTRTVTGEPGEDYWQNYVRYDIDATLRPSDNMLHGRATVTYHNNAPQELNAIYIHLRPNLFRPEALRNWSIGQTTDGMRLIAVRVEDTIVSEQSLASMQGYAVQGTLMRVNLPTPLQRGNEVRLGFEWEFEIPQSAPRFGRDSTAYFLGYWYPQIGVYDDLLGWDVEQYRGLGEFYMEFGDYDVRIRAPEGWLVPATGALQNAEEVLTSPVRARLAEASRSGDVVQVVSADARGAGSATVDAADDTLTWHYTAERVRDFAFGASAEYVWDAASAHVGDVDGDGVSDATMIHAFYRPTAPSWDRAAEFAQFGMSFLSERFMPYPYPHASFVEGPFPGGGMEYPMITLMGGVTTPRPLFEIVVHELAHNWWPIIVGSNEKRYMWQDEGPTHYVTQRAGAEYFEGWQSFNPDAIYYNIAGTETEIMRHADLYPSIAHLLIAIYPKTKIGLDILVALYGRDRVEHAIRVYTETWAFKHPTPWDLFNLLERELGDDLDWLWTSWFYETWTLDQSIGAVEHTDRGVLVTIRDHALVPMPAPVQVTYANGETRRQTLPVQAWLAGNRSADLLFPAGDVVRVEIDPEKLLPDVYREDNVWTPAR